MTLNSANMQRTRSAAQEKSNQSRIDDCVHGRVLVLLSVKRAKRIHLLEFGMFLKKGVFYGYGTSCVI